MRQKARHEHRDDAASGSIANRFCERQLAREVRDGGVKRGRHAHSCLGPTHHHDEEQRSDHDHKLKCERRKTIVAVPAGNRGDGERRKACKYGKPHECGECSAAQRRGSERRDDATANEHGEDDQTNACDERGGFGGRFGNERGDRA